MKRFLSAKILFVVWLIATGFTASAAPPDVYLAPENLMLENPYYRKVCEARSKPALLEKAKIQFLIGEIRQSQYDFIRNGAVHTSAMAAKHILMKYTYAFRHVKTTDDFIVKIASASSKTHESYLVRFDENTIYPARDILYNELHRLESTIDQKGCS